MKVAFGAMALALAISFAGSAGAITSPTNATAVKAGPPANMTIVQRCRCMERRWDGSCKLRVCRDRW
jgi:hypothetical protein